LELVGVGGVAGAEWGGERTEAAGWPGGCCVVLRRVPEYGCALPAGGGVSPPGNPQEFHFSPRVSAGEGFRRGENTGLPAGGANWMG